MSFWYDLEDPLGAFQLANELKRPLLVYTADESDLSRSFDSVFTSGKANQVITDNYVAFKVVVNSPQFKALNGFVTLEEKANVSIFFDGIIRAKIEACDSDGGEFVGDLSKAILAIRRLDAGESADSVRDSLGPDSNTTFNLRPLSKEEKAKKKEELRALIEKRRLELQIREKEEEKEREAHRREQGKMISAAKVQQQEKEAKLLLEKKLQEKREERLAKQRVRDLIAQDKAERAARRQKATEPPAKVTAAAPLDPKVDSGDLTVCKLGIRLPDGSTQRLELDPSQDLSHLREKLEGMVGPIAGSYVFVLSFPRKRFSNEDERKTLLELGLCPSNSLIIERI